MKKNIRKITVNEKVYLYNIHSKYCDRDTAMVTLRIYLESYRSTPYVMIFKCLDDYFGGASLYVGEVLFNSQTHLMEVVTLHRPYFVRLCILKALEQGWDASKMQINDNGMQFLTELNLDISKIEVKT